jgi:DNA-binding NtrC family response regulator
MPASCACARRGPSPSRAGKAIARLPVSSVAARPVLVAGADSAKRAAVLDDLAQTMSTSTVFAEADTFWKVLVRAPSSSMVILSDELDYVPAESLMQMLVHRHPDLPVVSVAAFARSAG